MKARLALLAALPVAVACQPRRYNQSADTKNILYTGASRMRPVLDLNQLPSPLAERINGIGRAKPNCTYTYLGRFSGRALALTAGHCLGDNNGNNSMNKAREICGRTEIVWGYWGPHTEPPANLPRTRCKDVVAWEQTDNVFDAFFDWRNDYALVEIDLPADVQLPAFDIEFGKPSHRSQLVVLSHPKGLPMHFTEPCKLFFMDYNAFKAIYGIGDFDYDAQVNRFLHNCDTEGGSSGAALLDANTFKIVGIHKGGPQSKEHQLLDVAIPKGDPERTLPKNPAQPWLPEKEIQGINQATFVYKLPLAQFLR